MKKKTISIKEVMKKHKFITKNIKLGRLFLSKKQLN